MTVPDNHEQTAEERRRIERALVRMAFVTWLLDECVRVPGTDRRIGLDGILGLLPGAGDAVAGVFQMYLLVEAGLIGVRRGTLGKMFTNVVIDTVVGCIPIVGDLFDFLYKSSSYNLELARHDLGVDEIDDPLEIPAPPADPPAADDEPEPELWPPSVHL